MAARSRARRGAAAGGLIRASLPARGFAAGLALTGLLLLQQLVLGRTPFGDEGFFSDVWVAAVHCFAAAWLPAAYMVALVSGRRTVDGLAAPVTSEVAPYPPFRPPSPAWLAAGAAGLALTFLGPWLTEPHLGGPLWFWNPARWYPEVWWHRVLGLWIGVWIGWYALALIQVSRRLSRFARAMPELDLFDRSALRPFVRHGLSNALSAAGMVAIVGMLGFDLGVTRMLIVFGGLGIALVAVAIALPLFGVRDRILAARAAELDWCDAAIPTERTRLRTGAEQPTEGRLADLVAYRTLAERVDAWPVDAPALRRAILYLLIPLLSWVGGAVVQTLVEGAMR